MILMGITSWSVRSMRPDLSVAKTRNYPLAIALVVLYVGAGGAAKLAGLPYVHSSFPKLGLPAWFGYFIGAVEVLGCLGLLVRPLSALAALGIGVIMIGATYYDAAYTPVIQAVPALVLTTLCIYIFFARRTDALKFNQA